MDISIFPEELSADKFIAKLEECRGHRRFGIWTNPGQIILNLYENGAMKSYSSPASENCTLADVARIVDTVESVLKDR